MAQESPPESIFPVSGSNKYNPASWALQRSRALMTSAQDSPTVLQPPADAASHLLEGWRGRGSDGLAQGMGSKCRCNAAKGLGGGVSRRICLHQSLFLPLCCVAKARSCAGKLLGGSLQEQGMLLLPWPRSRAVNCIPPAQH